MKDGRRHQTLIRFPLKRATGHRKRATNLDFGVDGWPAFVFIRG